MKILIILVQILFSSVWAQNFNPDKTWVFIVGVLEWQYSDSYDSFSKLERVDQKLQEAFLKQGVNQDKILFIKDSDATLENINNSLTEMLSKSRTDDSIFIYFAGHGDQGYFIPYDTNPSDFANTAWSVRDLFSKLNIEFKGKNAFITGDNCFSGWITKEAKTINSNINFYTLTSTEEDKISTANWTFTEALVDGIGGEQHVDSNNDQIISFKEIMEHTKLMMWIKEKQKITSAISKNILDQSFNFTVLSRPLEYQIDQSILVFVQGDYYRAKIIKKYRNLYFVKYDNYNSSYNEWITDSQIINAY